MSQERKALNSTAISVMLLLTAVWGFHQVTVKWIASDVSLIAQAAIRSIIATALLFAWARLRGAGAQVVGVAAGRHLPGAPEQRADVDVHGDLDRDAGPAPCRRR